MVCNDLSSKEPHIKVGVDRVMISRSLGGELVSILSHNARYVGSVSALGAIFPMFPTPLSHSTN